MLRTVVSGIVALALATTFLAVVLLKIQEPVLWIVVGIGVAMMAWNLIETVRHTRAAGDQPEATLPGEQQERGGVS